MVAAGEEGVWEVVMSQSDEPPSMLAIVNEMGEINYMTSDESVRKFILNGMP